MCNKTKHKRRLLVLSITLMMISSIFILIPTTIADDIDYDYVIITTNDIVSNSEYLDFFVKMKENEGHNVKIVVESDFEGLTGQYPNDRADKIRQWLINNYIDLDIDYVLLIGNPDPDSYKDIGDSVGEIPMKMCYPRYFKTGQGAPTDLYYSDLTSNWDLDGDGYFHEALDINNPESPDPSIHKDTFSVLWHGEVMCDYNVEYTFKILSDDGIRIMIDGNFVIENWDEHELMYDEWTGLMSVGKHDISIFFREHYGDAVCKLYWKTEVDSSDPCYIKNTLIPSDHLYDADGTVGGLTGFYYNNIDFTDFKVQRVDPEIDFIWGTGDYGLYDPDYNPEVFVGRIPVYDDDYEKLDGILKKIIDYETDPDDISWRNSILLPMVRMNDVTTSAGLGECIKDNIAIPNGFSYYRIYESDSGFSPELHPPTISNVKNEWANGYGMVTWHTHGGETGASHVINTDNIWALDNSKPAFTFQGSCHNAYPENKNNLAYSLLDYGAIATIAGTRMTTFLYGDYLCPNFNPIEFSNHQMAYYYTKHVIDSNMPAGKAYSEVVKYHKSPNSNAIEFNLYGDPECHLLSTNPNHYPVADANGPYSGYALSTFTFDASGSYDPEGESIEYRWDFDGDDTWDTSWSINPYAQFQWDKEYSGTVQLEVRDEIGKTDISTTTVTVLNNPPVADFTFTPNLPINSDIVLFNDLSYDIDGYIVSWLWDFGDGHYSTLQNPCHCYYEDGTYYINLTVEDDSGGKNYTVKTLNVFTETENLDQEQAVFQSSEKLHGSNFLAQSFTPSYDTLTNINLYLSKTGIPYDDLILCIRSSLDGPDLAMITIPANEISNFFGWVEFDISDFDVICGNTYYIVIKTNSNSWYDYYSWGNTYSNFYEPGLMYKYRGYNWQSYYTKDFCFKTFGYNTTGTIDLRPTNRSEFFPVVSKDLSEVCVDYSYYPSNPVNSSIIQFLDTSNENGQDIVSWTWDFGDGYFSDLQDPVHCFYEDGTFDVKLISEDYQGKTNFTTKTMDIITDTELLDQKQENFQSYNKIYSYYKSAQSFKPSYDILTKIELFVSKSGNPTDDLSLSVRSSLMGPDLATYNVSVNCISGSMDWIEFDINDFELNSGNTYYLILKTKSSSWNHYYRWGKSYSDCYSLGWLYKYYGYSWQSYITQDFCFRTYGYNP